MLVKKLSVLLLLAGVVLGGSFAFAQDKPKPAEKPMENAPEKKAEKADPKSAAKPTDAPGAMDAAMMEAYMKAAAPNENHKLLSSLAGNWKSTVKSWMGPSPEPETSSGSCESTMILGGRFLQSKVKGDMGGQPFEGVEIMGFDNFKKKFVSSWVDNMGTGIMLSEGTHDTASKTVTLSGSFDDPMTGQPKKVRSTLKIDGPDQHAFMMYDVQQGGKETKILEISYSRVK